MERARIVVAAAWFATAVVAHAQGAADAALPPPPVAAPGPSGTARAAPAMPVPRPLVPQASVAPPPKPVLFAPASAAMARRLTPEQRDEWRFLKEAAAASRLEAEASRLALARSGNAQVRSVAATLINQHASSSLVLQQALHARNMAAPMLSNDQRKLLNRLGKLQGTKFDREYLEGVAIGSQQESVALYERASGAVRDPALKAWIDRTLPTLKWQLASAERSAPAPQQRVVKAPVSQRDAARSAAMATRAMGGPPAQMQPAYEAMQLGPAMAMKAPADTFGR